MKAYQITGTNGLDSLQPASLADPIPGSGEVLIRVRAVCLNYRDYMNVLGIRGVTGPVPRTPCSDGAGEIVAVGDDVSNLKVGDRVVCPFMPTWLDGEFSQAHASQALGGAVDGLLRELAVVRAESLLPVPAHLSLEEAATLPCAAVTAWDALHCRGGIKAGETVLVLGTGGVSVFALQFAKLAGARVLAITSSEEKAAKLVELGADAVCNYRTNQAWDDWALAQTGGRGVDKVIEIGGPETLNRSLNATRFGGHISLIGVLTGTSGEIQMVQILRKGIRLDGIYVGSRAMFAQMLAEIERVKLRPVIDSTFEFDNAHDAFRRIESGKHFGKIVIRV
ncbi:NAD(P)-dependent alcohol dehydrogenase [Prosthecobacter sp.]|uniref:zinc-dependent alcohol dehydrogenase family protein n=1 Tax=Prosthecobacter sp. TaxID=1965333 RepID=UPI001E045824|nr:NAD(P)-dependent alcohol dehydrogenase [Prosthecobacter sp.]MCB1275764.1 NAD(P)-dependent alcohol dehydrogenase [Prosthecobacter sp.]